MENEIKPDAIERIAALPDFPRTSYQCTTCGDCKTVPCERADCGIPTSSTQAPLGCMCGDPRAVGVMHRSEGACQATYAVRAQPVDVEPLKVDPSEAIKAYNRIYATMYGAFCRVDDGKPARLVFDAVRRLHSMAEWAVVRAALAAIQPAADLPLQRYVWPGDAAVPLRHLTKHDGPFYACADVDALLGAAAIQSAAPQSLLNAGAKTANTMYNLAQQPGHVLTARDCELFSDMRKEWDAARTTPTAPDASAVRDAAGDDPIRKLIALHSELLEESDYTYFELARTRTTGWMAWICSHPSDTHPDRKVLARGQGDTPDEACADALAASSAATKEDLQ